MFIKSRILTVLDCMPVVLAFCAFGIWKKRFTRGISAPEKRPPSRLF